MAEKYEPIFWDIETTGLNPMAQHWWDGTIGAQVISVGVGRIHNWREVSELGEDDYDLKVMYDSDEYRLLQRLTEVIEENINDIRTENTNSEPVFVGWNTRNFDHPYIGARYARLRLESCQLNHEAKRLDMMRALGNDEVMSTGYPGQDDYAEELGIPVNDELTGEDMPKAFERDDWDKIAQHVEDDVEEMMKVFNKKKEDCWEQLYYHYDDITENPPKFTEEVEY
jgi:uncharacterized protein YprB with RNaseH-like and TPR domain